MVSILGEVTGDDGNQWYEILYGEGSAFVSAQYVTVNETATDDESEEETQEVVVEEESESETPKKAARESGEECGWRRKCSQGCFRRTEKTCRFLFQRCRRSFLSDAADGFP